MSAQMKHSLAALLAAAAVMVPTTAEAKGGNGHGGSGGHEQNQGGGGPGDFRGGGGNKHAELRQEHQGQVQAAQAPRQVFEIRGNGKARHARQERFALAQSFALARLAQKHEASGRQRWKDERHAARAAHSDLETRPKRERGLIPYAYGQRIDRDFKSDRKFEKQIVKQQRATYRAEYKQERRWAKQQRQAMKQAAKGEPVVAYRRSFAGYPRVLRYSDVPAYRMAEARQFGGYPAYAPAHDYAPQYLNSDAYNYDGWSNPQGYAGWPTYSSYPAYSPYDAGYGNAGLGGLFGGGGGLGDILAALLPLVLGDNLEFGGLTSGSLGSGFLSSAMPGLAGGYGLNDYPVVDFADSQYSYADSAISPDLLGTDQTGLGGYGLMSLAGRALGSGLLGGDSGGLGGLGGLIGLGGALGLEGGLGLSDPDYAYADPYASNTSLLSAFGV
jgi:hypothetical protein